MVSDELIKQAIFLVCEWKTDKAMLVDNNCLYINYVFHDQKESKLYSRDLKVKW